MWGLRNLDSGFRIYNIDFFITVELRKPWTFGFDSKILTELITTKFKTREKTLKAQPITAGVCDLVFSRLIGFVLTTQ